MRKMVNWAKEGRQIVIGMNGSITDKDRKYKLVNIEYDIPKYFKYNYDALCRKRNIFIPENLKECIKGFARKNKMEYISKVNYKKNDTNEELTIYFTSPITENKIWKIEYKDLKSDNIFTTTIEGYVIYPKSSNITAY